MEQVRCTSCGSTAIIPDSHGEFCKCEACGSTFNVPRAQAFSKVVLDHTQDIRAWREYLSKQLKLQQESNKSRDYAGVKLFAQKILSVLPDDFRAQYYLALAERYADNDTAYVKFLAEYDFDGVTPDERKEVAGSVVSTVEPKYLDSVKAFIARAYPDTAASFEPILDRNIKLYIQKLRHAKVAERDVFICHRTDKPDQDIADAICTRLEERGLRCWIAPRNILAGSQNYERDILKGVENCRLFLLVSSFKSIYSEDCEMELKAAVLENKALYSYRIDDTPYDGAFEKALSAVQWLDASDDPYAYLEQLVVDVKSILAEDEREKAELEEKRLAARERERVLAEHRRNAEQQRIERLEQIVSGGVAATGAVPTYNLRSKLKRAEAELAAGNYEKSQSLIDAVLDVDPENPLAWWLLVLGEYEVADDAELLKLGKDFTANGYFRNAEKFAELDPAFAARFERTVSSYRNGAVREVSVLLDAAETSLAAENFDELSSTLKHCEKAFEDEDGFIFARFPDMASKFYWLSLWAKYGQTKLVCVEDITREREYGLALKYASPTQKLEYERARETVSKNAENFLRERSKYRVNDGKLSDYLTDNKNILPVDVYRHYSSLLYFRRMLKALNVTEEQLSESAMDITTNEYFMLAQSLATDEQKSEYDALLRRLEINRNGKREKERRAREQYEKHRDRGAAVSSAKTRARNSIVTVFAVVGYVLFVIALASFSEIDHLHVALGSLLLGSVVFRLMCDIVMLQPSKGGRLVAITAFNIVCSVLTWAFVVFADEISVSMLLAFDIAAFILEVVRLNRLNKEKKDNEKGDE